MSVSIVELIQEVRKQRSKSSHIFLEHDTFRCLSKPFIKSLQKTIQLSDS